jgi:uncharacterized RDD family membrane protein YckC
MYCTKCGSPVSGNFCPSCGAAVAPPEQAVSPTPAPPPGVPLQAAPPMDYATWSSRVFGYLIDSVFVLVAMCALYVVATLVFGSAMSMGSLVGSSGLQGLGGLGCCCMLSLFPVASLAVGLYNKVYLVSQRGFSVGQGVMNLKVVDEQNHLLSQGAALLRLVAHAGLSFIPFLGLIDLLWPLWDDRRQTLHDKAVGCFVINNPGGR